ncbi:protein kinase [Chloracidobacterium sp. MS 40/45]|uniref:serine/threonine-protein kinase n=1 Tax=Chloracidobacterium aggregatum TaxID=2851959 RepID=UPI001B8BA7EF|nr:serine/threonine-protein kinase [Chloracidobacterium aggregatum]QUW00681.1 protein kinase [Chloracidobacterium sp. MS 40/45]
MTQPGTASQSSLIGNIIDNKVRLEAILGQGGMGAVYRGRHLLLERTVAVKVLRPEILTVEGSLERFFREARTAAATEHPNIVTVYDFGKLPDGGAYLILEFVEGKGLRHILLEQGVLPPSLALPILREVCAAVEFAHRRNIIHRDLKPDNIMLKRRDDGSATVKVLDFGLAKTVEEAETSSSITRTGELVGTPAYMSPEHCSGEDLDARSDLYSLAVIAYEMLVGQPPFRGRVAAILTAQIQKPPTPLRELNPDVPPVLEEAVLTALAKKPSDRPDSVADWWNRLEAAYAAAYGAKPSPAIPLSLPTPIPFKAPTGDSTPASEANPAQKATLQGSSLQPTPATQDTVGGTFAIGNPVGTGGPASSSVSSSPLSQAPATPTPRTGTGTLAIGAAATPAPEMVTVQTVATVKAPEPRSRSVQRLGIVGGISAVLVIGGLAATNWMRPTTPVTSPVEKPAVTPPLVTTEPPPATTPAANAPEEAASAAAEPPARRPIPADKARDEAARPPRTTPDESSSLPGPVARPTQPPAETPAPPPSRPPEEATRTEPPSTPRSQPGSGTARAPRAEQRQAEKREKRRFWEIWKIGRDKDDKDKDKRRPRD